MSAVQWSCTLLLCFLSRLLLLRVAFHLCHVLSQDLFILFDRRLQLLKHPEKPSHSHWADAAITWLDGALHLDEPRWEEARADPALHRPSSFLARLLLTQPSSLDFLAEHERERSTPDASPSSSAGSGSNPSLESASHAAGAARSIALPSCPSQQLQLAAAAVLASSAERADHLTLPSTAQPTISPTASALLSSVKRRKRRKSAAAAAHSSSSFSPAPVQSVPPAPTSSPSQTPSAPPSAALLVPPPLPPRPDEPLSARYSAAWPPRAPLAEAEEVSVEARGWAAKAHSKGTPAPALSHQRLPHVQPARQPSQQSPVPPQPSSAERDHSWERGRKNERKSTGEAKKATARPPPPACPAVSPPTSASSTSSSSSAAASAPSLASFASHLPATAPSAVPRAASPSVSSPASSVVPTALPPASDNPSATWARLASTWARKAQAGEASILPPPLPSSVPPPTRPLPSSSPPSAASSALPQTPAVAVSHRAAPNLNATSASPAPRSPSPMSSSVSPRVEDRRLPAKVFNSRHAPAGDGHQQSSDRGPHTPHDNGVLRRRSASALSQQRQRFTSTATAIATSTPSSVSPASSFSAIGRRQVRHQHLSLEQSNASQEYLTTAVSSAARRAAQEWRPQRILARGTGLQQLQTPISSIAPVAITESKLRTHEGEDGREARSHSPQPSHSPDLPYSVTTPHLVLSTPPRQRLDVESLSTQWTPPASSCSSGVAPRSASDSHLPRWPPRSSVSPLSPRSSAVEEDDGWTSESKSRTRSQPVPIITYGDEEDHASHFNPQPRQWDPMRYDRGTLLSVPHSTFRTDIWGQPVSPARSDDASLYSTSDAGPSWDRLTPSPPRSSALSSAFGSSDSHHRFVLGNSSASLFSYTQPIPLSEHPSSLRQRRTLDDDAEEASQPSVVIHSAPFLSPLSSAVRLEDLQQSYDSLLSDGEDEGDGAVEPRLAVPQRQSINADEATIMPPPPAHYSLVSSPSLAWTRPTTVIDDAHEAADDAGRGKLSMAPPHPAIATSLSNLSIAARPFHS